MRKWLCTVSIWEVGSSALPHWEQTMGLHDSMLSCRGDGSISLSLAHICISIRLIIVGFGFILWGRFQCTLLDWLHFPILATRWPKILAGTCLLGFVLCLLPGISSHFGFWLFYISHPSFESTLSPRSPDSGHWRAAFNTSIWMPGAISTRKRNVCACPNPLWTCL